jgi:hypothetical protein
MTRFLLLAIHINRKRNMIYTGIVITLISAGAAASWASMLRPEKASVLEHVSGALLIAGLSLIGIGLPLVHRFTAG